MKGLSAVAKATKNTSSSNRASWVKLYYSFDTDTVYTKAGEERFYVTDLINPQDGNDVRKAVERWLAM